MMNNRGQSMIEYLLLTAAVCVVLIIFLGPTGPFRGAMENSLNLTLVNSIEGMSQNVVLNLDLLP